VFINEAGRGIVLINGEAYVAGGATSNDFPTSNPYQASIGGGDEDAFVSKFSSDGSVLLYCTYLGGASRDCGSGLSVDPAGAAYISGNTDSADFPTENPYQSSLGGLKDAFVSKLSSTGSVLIYSSYLGGAGGNDYGSGIVVESGEAFITGSTGSSSFPTVNPYQGTYGGGSYDAFVSRLSSSGSDLLYSTYLGGAVTEFGEGIRVESAEVYIGGRTDSGDFPTENPYQAALGGLYDAFVSRFSSTGSTLLYSSYLGGAGSDSGYGISVESAEAYLTGNTGSTDFPTENPYQASHSGGTRDVFASKLSSTGSSLIYSTYLGGSAGDYGYGIYVESADAYLIGYTSSPDFPTANSYQGVRFAGTAAYVTRLSSDGSRLLYSTYLGGSTGASYGNAIAVENDDAYVTGYTIAPDFPTVNPYQATLSDVMGGGNAFVSKLDFLDGVIFEEPIAVTLDYSGSFSNSTDYVDNYDSYGECVKAPVETGPDVVYRFTIAAGGDLTLELTNLSADLDLILTDGPEKDDCAAVSWNSGTEDERIDYAAAAGTYYAVVDGYQGAVSSYDLSITFSAFPSPTPSMPPTPSTTPTPPTTPTPTPDGCRTPTPSPTTTPTPAPTAKPVDPAHYLDLEYSTFLGGAPSNCSYGLSVDAAGAAYLTGYTTGADFPTVNPYQSSRRGSSYDVFISKLSSTGSVLIYSTYLGGSDIDRGCAIALDGFEVCLAGSTRSSDFPTVNPYQASNAGGYFNIDLFVSRLSSTGSTLLYSTYLGGSANEYEGTPMGIAVASGAAYVISSSKSTDFPTVNPYQASNGGYSYTAIVSKLSSTGSSLLYSTYLGGSSSEYGHGIDVENGNAYLTGFTNSDDFPTVNAYQPARPGGNDVFVSKLSSDGSVLLYSTYLGSDWTDRGYGIAVENSLAYVTGETSDADFPTVNPYQSSFSGVYADAFVSKFSSTGSDLLYSTYLGGSGGDDKGYGVAVAGGQAYVTGRTASGFFPIRHAYQPGWGGGNDVFLTRFSTTGSALIYSSYLGGNSSDCGYSIVLEGSSVYLAGSTGSANFPTNNPYQAVLSGSTDAFAARLALAGNTFDSPITVTLNYDGDWNNTHFNDDYDSYDGCIKDSTETGPDVVYQFSIATGGTLTIDLTNLSADLDLILTDGSDQDDCVDYSDNSGTSDEHIDYDAPRINKSCKSHPQQ
jgi:hypothetical protein